MMHKKAKLDTLKALKRMAMDEIRGRMTDEDMSPEMSKVVVKADDKDGLEAGLNKAKDVLSDLPMDEDEEESSMMDDLHPSEKSPEDEEAMLLARLEELRAKKRMAQ